MMKRKYTFDIIGLDGNKKDIIKLQNISNINISQQYIKRMTKYSFCTNKQPQKRFFLAGKQSSGVSLGTGRALARVPRIKGSGTLASGQGTKSNMCRGGKTFGVKRNHKSWFSKLNRKEKTKAYESAYNAALFPSLVISRGHLLNDIKIFPIIIENLFNFVNNRNEILRVLKNVGGLMDLKKNSKHIPDKIYKSKKGPLLLFSKHNSTSKISKNLSTLDSGLIFNINFMKVNYIIIARTRGTCW